MTTDTQIDNTQVARDANGNIPSDINSINSPDRIAADNAAIDKYNSATRSNNNDTQTNGPTAPGGADTGQATGTTVTPTRASGTSPDWKDVAPLLNQGLPRDQIAQQIAANANISAEDADHQLVQTIADKVTEAKKSGIPEDQFKQYLLDNKVDPTLVDGALNIAGSYKPPKYDPNDTANHLENPSDIAAAYNEVHSPQSTILKDQIFGTEISQADKEQLVKQGVIPNTNVSVPEASAMVSKLNEGLVAKLKQDGYKSYQDPNTGEAMITDGTGKSKPVEAGFINSLYYGKSEIAGSIAGAITGAKLGSHVPTLIGKAIGTIGGGIAGGMMGAATGKAADMTMNAVQLRDHISQKMYLDQMKQAAIYDGVASVVGGAVAKVAGKGLMKAWQFTVGGNKAGAMKVLGDYGITKDEANQLVEDWENLTGTVLQKRNALGNMKAIANHFSSNETPVAQTAARPKGVKANYSSGFKDMSAQDKAITLVHTTQKVGDTEAKLVAQKSVRTVTSMLRDLDARAKAFREVSQKVAGSNTAKEVRSAIAAYEKEIKQDYVAVRDIGTKAVDGTDFKWDFDNMLTPLIRKIAGKDGAYLESPRLKMQAQHLLDLINHTNPNRQFSDLLDLKKELNSFSYKVIKRSTPGDKAALAAVKTKIDNTIEEAAKEYIPNGKDWIPLWSKVNKAYSEMLQLQEKRMYKSIMKTDGKEEEIRRVLNKSGNLTDLDMEAINPVLDKLPLAIRAKVEGATIQNLISKYTIGNNTSRQAIDFPELAQAVKALNLQTPRGKALADTIDNFAKVFKNDANLVNISGNMQTHNVGSGIGYDPIVRAKVALMGEVFHDIMRLNIFSSQINRLTLFANLNRLLKNPLHQATVDSLMKQIPSEDKQGVQSAIREVQVELAKMGKTATQNAATDIKMYKQTTHGTMTITDGSLGRGVYVVDKVASPDPAMIITKHDIDLKRMATLDKIRGLTGNQNLTETEIADIPNLQQTLIDQGYLGIRVSGKAMLFPDTTIGVKSTAGKKFVKVNTPSSTEQTVKAARQFREDMTPSEIKERAAKLATETPAQRRTRETLEAARNNQKPKF